MSRNFTELLEAQWAQKKFLCVGLDPVFERIPEAVKQRGTRETLVAFGRAIVDTTHDLVCAFKPNSAFYEVHGDEGWQALRETTQYIQEVAPALPVILDAKRADTDNTNTMYAEAVFEHLHADALTVNAYPGSEALKPFLNRKDKGVFVWCRSSNGGSAEFQDLQIDGVPLYEVIAQHVVEWNKNGNCGLVVGATYPQELGRVRGIAGDMPILVPGIGAQRGDLEKTVAAGKTASGSGMIIASSRSILYASSGADFAEAARAKAQELHGSIMKAL